MCVKCLSSCLVPSLVPRSINVADRRGNPTSSTASAVPAAALTSTVLTSAALPPKCSTNNALVTQDSQHYLPECTSEPELVFNTCFVKNRYAFIPISAP